MAKKKELKKNSIQENAVKNMHGKPDLNWLKCGYFKKIHDGYRNSRWSH